MKNFFATFIGLTWVLAAHAQTTTLTGRVRDAAGQPVPFASVAVPALKLGATADAEGNFQLENLPAGPVLVAVSAVGYGPLQRQLTLPLAAGEPVTWQLRQADAALSEVVVTGVSRQTEIRRSPVPIAALSRRELQLNPGANVLDAAVRGVPGLAAVTTGPNVSKPFIRGLGYNRVLTLYNGLRQEGQQWGDEHGLEVDGYDVERVEVVKGPASLLYGSDAVAGVVHLLPGLPRGPVGQLRGEAVGEFQSNNGLLGNSLQLNRRQESWFAGGRASYRQARNYRSPADGLVLGTGYRDLNLSLQAGLERRWGHSHWFATLYDNRQEIPDGSRDSLSRRFTRQVFEGDLDDPTGRPLASDGALRAYAIGPLHQRIQHYRLFTRNEFRLRGGDLGELHVLLGAQHNHRREYIYPTRPDLAGLDLQLTTFNYDLRYLRTRPGGWELTGGLNGMGQLNRLGPATDFAIPAYNLFDLGLYALAKKRWGEVEISGGLRYDWRSVRWNDFYVAPDPATGYEGAAGPDAPGARQQFAAFRPQYRGLSASAGASWVATERLTLRANAARGYRAPNIPEIGSNGLDPGARIVYLGNRGFRPEFSWQQDVGVLWHDRQLDLSVELFHNQLENYIYQARLADDNGAPVVVVPGYATYQYRQARARLYGLEASAQWRPASMPWLQASTSLAFANGHNEDAQLRARYGDAARYLPLLPPLQSRSELRANLRQNAAATGRLSGVYVRATADAFAAQNRYYAVDNTETRTPGYWLLGVGTGATWRTASGREAAQLFVQVDNLLDTAYQSHLSRLKYLEYYSASPTGRLGIFNPGRNLSVRLVVPF